MERKPLLSFCLRIASNFNSFRVLAIGFLRGWGIGLPVSGKSPGYGGVLPIPIVRQRLRMALELHLFFALVCVFPLGQEGGPLWQAKVKRAAIRG